ncbi:Mannose 6-phosphate receptor [Venustampulla echinocandica]|uniref:Autophagy-related protein 27 n=1 Tax=Venustampulla echinocandica TaxID=2656787 RepID=A0A370TJB8_9HELO|nr:Mannose 6-phosphate receptor [Venustampulla echinocandica]RDL35461.1 Mannose 6-phosphate receptor [Venustampulla echinocandica]
MRHPQSLADAAILTIFLLPSLTAAVGNIDCNHVRVDGIGFTFKELGGPRSAQHSFDRGQSFLNTTYTIDICRPLKKSSGSDPKAKCPSFTRLCAVERFVSKDGTTDVIQDAYPVAGELKTNGGGDMNAKWSRLKGSISHEDSKKEGLLLEIHGGYKKTDTEKKRRQRAVIEFLCDREKTGLENLPEPKDTYDKGKEKRAEDAPEEETDLTPSLTFDSYDTEGDEDTLRLEWRTKWACEDSKKQQDEANRSHWGFFTCAFLSTAAYLIFGSWLNYNRYGARGWDLLPHGDAIRDVPYLLRDWIRRVVNTIQGGGSRGGYAAV